MGRRRLNRSVIQRRQPATKKPQLPIISGGGTSEREIGDNFSVDQIFATPLMDQYLNTVRGQPSQEKNVYWKYIPLYQAALRGDWLMAETFFNRYEVSLTAKITAFSETALHIAAGAGRSSMSIDFVKKLVDKILQEVLDTISEETWGNQVDNSILEEALKKLEIGDEDNCTPLHIAAWTGNIDVVKILVGKRPSLIYIRDDHRRSALDLAARNAKKDTLNYLLALTQHDPLSKLFPKDASTKKNDPSPNVIKTPSESEPIYDEDSAAAFLIRVITSGFYDIALQLVKRYPELASVKQNNGDCGLQALARKVSAFKSGRNYKWWQSLIYAQVLVELDDYTTSHNRDDIETGDIQKVTRHKYKWARLLVEWFCTFVPCMKNIQAQKLKHHQALELVKCLCEGVRSLDDSEAYNLHAKRALLTAAKLGIHEVIEEIVESFPNLLWAKDEDLSLNIFHIAVKERHVNVFNLIYQMGDYRQLLVPLRDKAGNNLLHLAGGLGPNKNTQVSGATLQMQRELQWFEEVKKFANPRDIDWPNDKDITPPMLFTQAHEKLRGEGEKWMKETAKSCTIPTALIVTVVFAAAITVPGGINGNGLPILSKEVVFNIFAVSNAISLFGAITSLLVSLSILTCRYDEGDFLFALPHRLIIGLITLFLSITAMVIAFSAALYLMFGNKDRVWILYPVAALACIPIISFASLQFPLLVDLMVSTYGPRIFGKQSNRPFY